jgi:hypothetical protein
MQTGFKEIQSVFVIGVVAVVVVEDFFHLKNLFYFVQFTESDTDQIGLKHRNSEHHPHSQFFKKNNVGELHLAHEVKVGLSQPLFIDLSSNMYFVMFHDALNEVCCFMIDFLGNHEMQDNPAFEPHRHFILF